MPGHPPEVIPVVETLFWCQFTETHKQFLGLVLGWLTLFGRHFRGHNHDLKPTSHRDVVLESRTWTRVRLESRFWGLGLETCGLGLATYGHGRGLELDTSGLELGCFYLNENTLIS